MQAVAVAGGGRGRLSCYMRTRVKILVVQAVVEELDRLPRPGGGELEVAQLVVWLCDILCLVAFFE